MINWLFAVLQMLGRLFNWFRRPYQSVMIRSDGRQVTQPVAYRGEIWGPRKVEDPAHFSAARDRAKTSGKTLAGRNNQSPRV
jgi:hypothetical protein